MWRKLNNRIYQDLTKDQSSIFHEVASNLHWWLKGSNKEKKIQGVDGKTSTARHNNVIL